MVVVHRKRSALGVGLRQHPFFIHLTLIPLQPIYFRTTHEFHKWFSNLLKHLGTVTLTNVSAFTGRYFQQQIYTYRVYRVFWAAE